MRLVKSVYTIVHPNESGVLIYNTKNGAQVFIVKEEVSLQDDIKKLVNNECDHIENDTLRKYFCVNKQADEVLEVMTTYYKDMFDPADLSFIIMPNNSCNFGCIYCYQHHDNKYISSEILNNFISAIKDHYHNCGLRSFYTEWFGGEPLLSFEAIRKVTGELNQFFAEKNIFCHYGATTNGSLLTKERISYLLSNKFDFFQITIDGSPRNHNKTRPFLDGGPTWDVIFNNLLMMQEFDAEFNVSLRVNYNEDTLEDIEEFFEVVSRELDARFTVFFHSIGRWGGKHDTALKTIDNNVEPYIKKYLMDEAIKYSIEPRVNYGFFDPKMMICYAGKPYHFTLGADGNLRKCNEENEKFDSFNIVGTIKNGKIEIDTQKWGKFALPGGTSHLSKKCGHCAYLPICYGQNCPRNRIHNKKIECPNDIHLMSEFMLNKYNYFSKYKGERCRHEN
jgi:uncharacterized protein